MASVASSTHAARRRLIRDVRHLNAQFPLQTDPMEHALQIYAIINLTLIGIPFLSQAGYDRLLWACDLNFVRGEDSFVRALWAGKPLIWNIYPQQDAVHLQKLEAFLAIYLQDTPEAQALSAFWRAWNGIEGDPLEWSNFVKALPGLNRHAQHWAISLAQQNDLATQLVNFSQKPL